MYHYDSKKLETTAAGVNITGGTSAFNVSHTGGHGIGISRGSKSLTINANWAANNTHALIDVSPGMLLAMYQSGTRRCNFAAASFYPQTADAFNLGTAGNRFNEAYIKKICLNTSTTNSQLTINSGSAANAVSIRNTTLGYGNVGILFSTQDHSGLSLIHI